MTDEERKRLVAELREGAPDWTVSGRKVQLACDELERLAAELKEYRLYEENNSIDFERYPGLDPTRKNRIKRGGL